MTVSTLPDGSKGFDCDGPISPRQAKEALTAKYSFAIRYIRRVRVHSYDISVGEILSITTAGLGLMLVQHVDDPGWTPNAGLGLSYGETAVVELQKLGIPAEVSVWCDLEGVSSGNAVKDTIEYCNRWYDQLFAAGYTPGLYVGDSCGLSATGLYKNLKYQHYWSAYNLNLDNYPIVRGVQMKQRVAKPSDHLSVPLPEFDVDYISADHLGGTPKLLFR